MLPAVRVSDAEEEPVKATQTLVEHWQLRPRVALRSPPKVLLLRSLLLVHSGGATSNPVEAAHVEAAAARSQAVFVQLVRQGWEALRYIGRALMLERVHKKDVPLTPQLLLYKGELKSGRHYNFPSRERHLTSSVILEMA